MFRILHFSDLHLDSSFAASGLPTAVGTWRRVDLKNSLERILTLAHEQKVDAITIAGDLYDQKYALLDTAELLKQEFAQLAPIRVYISPGESDPYSSDALYALTRWPENVTIFSSGRLSAVEMAPGIHIWGASHPPARSHDRLIDFKTDRDGINLLLLHANDAAQTPPQGKVTAFSISAADVRKAGFKFALLGRQHTARLWPKKNPCCLYPGSPEPLALEEADGEHQAAILTIDKGEIKPPELISINNWHYLSLEVDITRSRSTKAIARRVQQSLQKLAKDYNERTLCYVTLTGKPLFNFEVKELHAQVETQAYIYYQQKLSLTYDLEQLAKEPTVRGLLAHKFRSHLKKNDKDIDIEEKHLMTNAINMALQALEGRTGPFNEIG